MLRGPLGKWVYKAGAESRSREQEPTSNVQHRTPNIQWRKRRSGRLPPWTLGVGCSDFSSVLLPYGVLAVGGILLKEMLGFAVFRSASP